MTKEIDDPGVLAVRVN